MQSKFLSRKFVLSMGCGIVCSILVWAGKISPDVFQWVTLGTVGAYIAGNVAQKKVSPSEE